jgi:hypothetical protein
MERAAVEIADAFERSLADELGADRSRELRAALEHIVERAGAGADLAARRVRIL